MSSGLHEPIPVPPVHLRPTPPAPPIDGVPIPLPGPEPAPAPEPPVVPPPPLAPTAPSALPDLGWLAALIVLLGLIALASALADFLNWLFRRMLGPFSGGRRTPTLDTKTLLQPLSNALGRFEQGIDGQIGLSFQKLAELETRVGRALVAAAQTTYQATAHLARLEQHSRVQDRQATTTARRAGVAQAAATHAQAQAATEAHRAGLAESALQGRTDALTHHVTHIIEPELEALRQRIPELEKGATAAWDLLKKHEEALSIAGVTAATAVGLSRLGGDWIRCEANQVIGRSNCGRNSDTLRKLLHGSFDILSLAQLCTLSRLIVTAGKSSVVQDALVAFSEGISLLNKCMGASHPSPLPIAEPNVGPVTAWAAPGPLSV